ncbi:fungal hydrophobin, partial [Marasmius fiardii PR-910]
CSTGPVQCCNSVQSSDAASVAGLLALVGAVVGPVTAQVGVTCNPISVIGAGINTCKGQTVCCEDNNFNGVVALGCNNVGI